jgi:hypothetical protein
MNKQITMELVWHNCMTDSPNEEWSGCLYLTDGNFVSKARYRSDNIWYNEYTKSYIPKETLYKYWWASLQQTVRDEPKFQSFTINDFAEELKNYI